MIYAKFDVNLRSHPRAIRAEIESPGCMSLYLWAMMQVRGNDGSGDFDPIELLSSWCDRLRIDEHTNALVNSGLWIMKGQKLFIHNYGEKNETSSQICERRKKTKERVTRYRSVTGKGVTRYTSVGNASVPGSDSGSVNGSEIKEGGVGETIPDPTELTKAQKLAMWESDHRDAFVRGVAAGKGGPHVWSGGIHEQGALNASVKAFGSKDTHGVVRDAKRLLRWTEAAGKDFAEAMVRRKSAGQFTFSLTGQGFTKWLNEEETNKIKETA